MKYVNLGCGPDGIGGWDNYDWGLLPLVNKLRIVDILIKFGLLKNWYSRKWPYFRFADVRKKLCIKSNSVDWIYCSHVIEHLEKYQAVKLLSEIFRVLKVGAKVRIVLPDLDKLIAGYNNDPDRFNRYFFGFDKDVRGGFFSRFIRPHNWMYNQKSFVKLLRDGGFTNIRTLSYKKGEMPNISLLDLELHRTLSFYVEAQK